MPLRCFCCTTKKIQPSTHPIEIEVQQHIADHRQFYNMVSLGKYNTITTIMVHDLTKRAARIIGMLNSLIEECGEERAKVFHDQFMMIDNLLYKELHRQFKLGKMRLTAGAMQLLYVQNRISMDKPEKSRSALF